jgi:hypothetical protein
MKKDEPINSVPFSPAIIQIGVPDGWDADEIHVTYRRRVPAEARVIDVPGKRLEIKEGKNNLFACRFCDKPFENHQGMMAHQSQCTKNPDATKWSRVPKKTEEIECPCGCKQKFIPKRKNQKFFSSQCRWNYNADKRKTPQSKKKYGKRIIPWKDSEITVLIRNSALPARDLMRMLPGRSAASIGEMRWELKQKGKILNESDKVTDRHPITLAEAAEEKAEISPPEEEQVPQVKGDGQPEKVKTVPPVEDDGHEPLREQLFKAAKHIPFFETVKDKFQGFKLPEDYNPRQLFGVRSYIYLAAAREIGKIVSINFEDDSVVVDFHDRTAKFTVDGARTLYEEMLVRTRR